MSYVNIKTWLFSSLDFCGLQINMMLANLYKKAGQERSSVTSYKEVLRQCPLALDAILGSHFSSHPWLLLKIVIETLAYLNSLSMGRWTKYELVQSAIGLLMSYDIKGMLVMTAFIVS